MVKRICLLVVCVFFFSVTGQSQEIDSLRSLLPDKIGAERIDILNELAYQYFENHDNNLALNYIKQANELSIKMGDSLRIVKTARLLASTMRRIGNIDSALAIYEKILSIAQRNGYKEMLPRVLNGVALSYTDMARYDKALDLHFQSLEIEQQLRDTAWITVTLTNIGLVYYKLKDYQKARNYYKQTIALKEKTEDPFDLDMIFVNTGLCYAYLKDFPNAKLFAEKSAEMCREDCLDHSNINNHFLFGVIYFGLKDLDKSEFHFLKSYVLAQKTDNTRFQFDNIDFLSQIYIQQNRIDEAIHFLTRGEALINQGAPYSLETIKIYEQFFRAYSKTKQYEKVSIYQKKYIELRDSVYNEERTLNLMRIEADFHERENIAKISAQNQILALREKVIDRQKLLKVFIVVMVLGLILLAGILIWNNRQKQLIRNALDIKVREKTDTLEQSYRLLMLVKKEREALLRHTSADINGSLSTITGLCNLGMKDISDPQSLQYISELNKVSNDLVFYVNKFQTLNFKDKKNL